MKQMIGLFGGTFDPVHLAHLALARQALKQFHLDSVIWIPAAISPFKKSSDISASAEHRMEMVKLACKNEPQFEVSDYEIKKGGVSYSIETLRHFQKLHPGAELFWILGADALAGVPKWKEANSLMQDLTFLVAGRGVKISGLPQELKMQTIKIPEDMTSATDLRAGLMQNKCWNQINNEVAAYIRKQKLYGVAQ